MSFGISLWPKKVGNKRLKSGAWGTNPISHLKIPTIITTAGSLHFTIITIGGLRSRLYKEKKCTIINVYPFFVKSHKLEKYLCSKGKIGKS